MKNDFEDEISRVKVILKRKLQRIAAENRNVSGENSLSGYLCMNCITLGKICNVFLSIGNKSKRLP